MARETDAILQSILFQHRKSKEFENGSIDDCIVAVEAMCTKENLDAVEALIAREKEKRRGK
ncbi:MAG: hypothetical protein FWH07_06030 [Oscillospiraceae bacterium]|nr:hypothetical protein [Oscillospiraceae bacterium]